MEPQPFTAQFGALTIGAVFYAGGICWIKKGERWAIATKDSWFCNQYLTAKTPAIFNFADEVKYW